MTRAARGAVFLVACAVALLGLPPGFAHAQTFDPQPYLVYFVTPEPLVSAPLVDLEDQFNLWEDVSVVERFYFMNPAEKRPVSPPGAPELITDPDLHYRWFTLDAAGQGTYTVQVTNQFGDEVPWEIESWPVLLLAPTSKAFYPGEPGPPPPGQHYDCYHVVNAPSAGAVVNMTDQFGTHGPSDVLSAAFLCVPAEKTKDQTVYPIFEATDGRDHLACYDVSIEGHTQLINTRSQFTGIGPELFVVEYDEMLCVPSKKTFERVPSLAPWGAATLGLLMLLTVLGVAQRRARHARAA